MLLLVGWLATCSSKCHGANSPTRFRDSLCARPSRTRPIQHAACRCTTFRTCATSSLAAEASYTKRTMMPFGSGTANASRSFASSDTFCSCGKMGMYALVRSFVLYLVRLRLTIGDWRYGVQCRMVYGLMTREDVDAALQGRTPGNFVIRFSERHPGQFGIAYVGTERPWRIKHYLVQPNGRFRLVGSSRRQSSTHSRCVSFILVVVVVSSRRHGCCQVHAARLLPRQGPVHHVTAVLSRSRYWSTALHRALERPGL